jgi:FMN reductase
VPHAPCDGGPAHVVVLSGSPAPESRTWTLAAAAGERLSAHALQVELTDLRALPADQVLLGAAGAGPVRAALDAVARARGVVVVTPVHHSAYSGLLKAFLDLLPRSALAGKVVLPLAVGGSAAHVLAIDYALRPVLVSLGAAHVTRGQVVLHDEIARAPDGAVRLDAEAERRLDVVAGEFAHGLRLHARGDFPPPPPRRAAPSGAERRLGAPLPGEPVG